MTIIKLTVGAVREPPIPKFIIAVQSVCVDTIIHKTVPIL